MRRALAPDAALDYRRPSLADEYEPAVRDVLADYPRLAVPQIASIVDWPGARSTLSALVARLRPLALEREREDLNRPNLGTVATGSMTTGTVHTGRMTVGSVSYGDAKFGIGDPRPAA